MWIRWWFKCWRYCYRKGASSTWFWFKPDFGTYEKGEVCEIGKFINSDEKLVSACEDVIKNLSKEDNFKVKIGTIASGDLFIADHDKALKIREEFGASCGEMEGAAIAQVCFLDGIPFLVIRGISDTIKGNNGIDFHEYLNLASKRAGEILKRLVLSYN